MQYLTTIMNEYGYLVLFLSIALGILALPIPMEAVLAYAGFLSFLEQLNWFGSILSSALGCTLGMLFSYWVGFKLGMQFFEKHGKRIHIESERLEAISNWIRKYGNKLLLISLFIPVFRHFIGYFSGITRVPIKVYTLYTGIGSTLWVSSFIFIGKSLGPQWDIFFEAIKKYVFLTIIVLFILIGAIYLFKKIRNVVMETGTK
ncbi:membrane-associated protein [Bacillus sp. AFS073361]|uniref:DedA family protein n=1 Tax=Bacillus sp. AFS073361 TaxID=2033511 RepID=UPI000BF69C4B|nr:DedA family protein [Bacillus sp. AFS073361]PFP25752.1 membrane-associated protein [Bacillus sp. AFS073361]